jgi:hypothetical protein
VQVLVGAMSVLLAYTVQACRYSGQRLLTEERYDTAGLNRASGGAMDARLVNDDAIATLALGAPTRGVLVAACDIATLWYVARM